MVDIRRKLIDVLVDFRDEHISINEAADTLVKMFGKHISTKELRKDHITDGYQYWPIECSECKKKTMEIVRPGKVQCSNCG